MTMNIKTLWCWLALSLAILASSVQAGDKPFRDRLKDRGEGPAMVVIPAGKFLMGSPANEAGRNDWEGPQHWVTVRRFALGQTEVTFDDYDRFARATGRPLPFDHHWGRGSRPVINVSWRDAHDYAEWLAEQTGEEYRLPSEAEWEYAARAGTTTPFSTGSCISTEQANFNNTSKVAYAGCPAQSGPYLARTQPAGSYPSNAFGLYDMHGNVGEWLQDCWYKTYVGAPSDGTGWLGLDAKCGRVARGGSWGTYPAGLRSASRFGSSGHPDGGGPSAFNGFRVARSIQK